MTKIQTMHMIEGIRKILEKNGVTVDVGAPTAPDEDRANIEGLAIDIGNYVGKFLKEIKGDEK